MYSSETAVTERPRPVLRLPVRMLGEQRLARLAARGERRAFEELFRRYHRELYRYCRAILGQDEDARDALQNTMTVAIRHLPNGERRHSLRGWLYRVAHNEAVSIMRRRVVPVDPGDLPERAVPDACASLEERERLRHLVADLLHLPERQRGALVMRELSDLGYADIGAAMGTSEASARQLVYEARESLRTLALGRDLDCASVRRVISERDGRRLRARRLRAHLGECDSCRDYEAAISTRRSDLGALFPLLAPGAGSGLVASLLGGAGQSSAGAAPAGPAGAMAIGGGTSGAALGGVGIKAASLVSVVAIGAGAAGVSHELPLPSPFSGDEQRIAAPVPAPGHAASRDTSHAQARSHNQTPAAARSQGARGPAATGSSSREGSGHGRGAERSRAESARQAHPPATATFDAGETPGPAAAPAAPPASSSASPPEHAGSGGPPATPPGLTPESPPPASGSNAGGPTSSTSAGNVAVPNETAAEASGRSVAPGPPQAPIAYEASDSA